MKTYLLIGAGPGIGLATAQRFARDGYRIVLASRTGKALTEHVDALRANRVEVIVDTVDAADPARVADLVHRYADDLAVIHYNAGVLHYDGEGQLQTRPLNAETPASIEHETRVNLVSALAAVQAASAVMVPRKAGTILLTGGGFGVEPTPDFINISVAKAGLRAAARALFEPLKAHGTHLATVTVSTLVSPESDKAREVGDAFWNLHTQSADAWQWEAVVQ